MTGLVHAEVTEQPLDVAAHEDMVGHGSAGAVVSFAGVVRDHDGGRSVTRLTYEGHPDASVILRKVAAEIADSEGVTAVAVSHRVGDLAIGDAALVAVVAGPHRAPVFTACAKLVDDVKAQLPIWKHQYFTDGTDEWVNCP